MRILDLSGHYPKADGEIVQGKRGTSAKPGIVMLEVEEALANVADFDVVAIGPDETPFDKAVAVYGGDCKVIPVSKGPDGWEIVLPAKKKKAKAEPEAGGE